MNNQTGYCQARLENEWATMNPVLGLGEMGYATDVYGLKIGDGFTPWNNLPYVNQHNKQVQEDTELLPVLEDMVVRSADILGPEPYIEIKPDRSIEVPEVLKNVAVQYDAMVETVTFRCPRYWDEHDLSNNSEITILYHHSTSDSTYNQQYITTAEILDDDYFTFDWEIGYEVTQKAGSISFSINILSQQDQWSWNSQICQNGFNILPGYQDPDDVEYGDLTKEEQYYFDTMLNDLYEKVEPYLPMMDPSVYSNAPFDYIPIANGSQDLSFSDEQAIRYTGYKHIDNDDTHTAIDDRERFKDFIVTRNAAGNVSTGIPQSGNDAVNKEYLEEQIATTDLSWQNQFNNSILDRIEFSVFKQWGIVGDSLSVGYTRDSEGEQHPRNIEYSWGQHLARKMGNNCLHFGTAGIGAKEWMTNPQGYTLLQKPEQLCQCYILALGANEAETSDVVIGNINDIDFNNMTNNADTEYGWYARVINAIQTTAPQAPIFLLTLPYPRNTDDRWQGLKAQEINNMIRELAANENFSKLYLVDLDANYDNWFNQGKIADSIGNTGNHFTVLGYAYISTIIEKAISQVMFENYLDFQDIFKIPCSNIYTADQKYQADSVNAQSGKAVAEALAKKRDILTAEGNNTGIKNNHKAYAHITQFPGNEITNDNSIESLAYIDPYAHPNTLAIRDNNSRIAAIGLNYPDSVIGEKANSSGTNADTGGASYPNYLVSAGNIYDFNKDIRAYIDEKAMNIPNILSNIIHLYVKPSGNYYDFDDNGEPKPISPANGKFNLEPGCAYLAQGDSLKIVDSNDNVVTDVSTNPAPIKDGKALLIIVPSKPTYTQFSGTAEYRWRVYCMRIASATEADSQIFEIIEQSGNKDKTLDTKLRSTAIARTDGQGFDVWKAQL